MKLSDFAKISACNVRVEVCVRNPNEVFKFKAYITNGNPSFHLDDYLESTVWEINAIGGELCVTVFADEEANPYRDEFAA